MEVLVRCCGLGPKCFAADGSHIGETAVRNYLESKEYKLSVEGKLTVGYLTHRGRSLEVLPNSIGTPGIKKVIGRDDAGLCVGDNLPTYTHYVKEFYIEDIPGEGPWLCARVHIFDEKDFDEKAAENIKRLKGLIRSGVKLTCSLVVLAFWSAEGNGVDECKSIKAIKSLDWTVNPSFGPLARITEVFDDDEVERDYSTTEEDNLIQVRVFSEYDYGDLPKSSKIDGKYTILKAKEYSTSGSYQILEEEEPQEKEFSVATLKERVRYANLSPRMRFRRLFIDYKQMVKSGYKPEEEKILKSLFHSDVLDILKTINPDVMAGKQINTLIGASSLGKPVREAVQKLQLPYRYALQEVTKTGKLSPMRYKKIQDAFIEFSKAMEEEVFGTSNPVPESVIQEAEKEEGENGEN